MKSRKGCLIWLLIVVTFYAGIVLVIKALSKEPTITQEYVVQADDTLWSIAGENKKAKQDIREYVHQLRKLNSIDDCIIVPGQTIQILK